MATSIIVGLVLLAMAVLFFEIVFSVRETNVTVDERIG